MFENAAYLGVHLFGRKIIDNLNIFKNKNKVNMLDWRMVSIALRCEKNKVECGDELALAEIKCNNACRSRRRFNDHTHNFRITSRSLDQRIAHDFFCLTGGGHSTARIASSKTCFKPTCVRAEHSKYLIALISFAI